MGVCRWVVAVCAVAACTGVDEVEVGEEVQEQVAWDPLVSKMPQWGCELPTAGATVEGTNRTYADAGTVQQILDDRCNGCHDGMKNGGQPLKSSGRARIYRWLASYGVNTAMFAPQIVAALRDDGDGQKNSSGFDGAMWNLSQITESERAKVYDHFKFCADHPNNNTVLKDFPQPHTKSYNHYLIGRSYLTGINWPNAAPAGDPGTNGCIDVVQNQCVVDEQGLELPASAAEMDRFYTASQQGQLDTLGKWIATRTPNYVRMPGESIEAFRDRTKTAVYYNQNELALGREMWCGEWPANCSDEKGGGVPKCNLACGVTNYGYSHNDVPNALATATRRRMEKNTVVISYNVGLSEAVNPIDGKAFGPGYAVQFAAYGPTGARLDKAQLDYQGPRPASYICTNCHGGWYDPSVHLVYEAKLLPANPHDVRYTDSPEFPTSAHDSQLRYVRTSVQAKLQAMNELMYNWVKKQEDPNSPHHAASANDRMLLPAQISWFEAIYCANVPGCAQGNGNGGPFVFTNTARHVAPTNASMEGWQTWGQWPCSDPKSQYVRDIYHGVIQPYCIGCHNAFIDEPFHVNPPPNAPIGGIYNNADYGGSNPMVSASRFISHWADLEKYFIRNGRMPHAEHTLKAFWTRPLTQDGTPTGAALPTYDCGGNVNGYLTSDGTRKGTPYPSAKWLLYDRMAKPGVSGLLLPEAQVNDPVDTCNAIPNMCGDPDHSGRACVNGACVDRCDTNVRCPVPIDSVSATNPNRNQCVAATNTCEPCGRAGQKVCLVGAVTGCDPSLNPGCLGAGLSRCESGTSEFSQFLTPDSAHTYGDVDRCLIDLADRDPKEVDRDLNFPKLIPTDLNGNRLPTPNGTPGFAPWPLLVGTVPSFAGFTLSSSVPSSGASGTYCTNNCKERIVDGQPGSYFDSSTTQGGWVDIDFGRNRSVYAVKLSRETVASTLLDDTNVYYQVDGGAWMQIPAANGHGAGVYTINGFPANTTDVWVKVPVAAGPIRKLRVRRWCSNIFCSKQIRLAEMKVYGY